MLTDRQQNAVWETARWAVVVGPSLIASLILALWLQWLLPQEDDFGFDRILYGLVLTGLWRGFAEIDGLAQVWRRSLTAATVVLLLPWLVVPLLFILMMPIWIAAVIVYVAIVVGTYRASRALACRIDRRWRQPIAASLLVTLCSFTLFGSPILESYKWCWPWTSFRHELEAKLDEQIRLGDETELVVNYRFPIINKSVHARLQAPRHNRPEYIHVYWGRRQFGPLNLRTGWILWASD